MPTGIPIEPDEAHEIKHKIISHLIDGYNITLTAACLAVKVSRTVVYEWLDADPDFKAALKKAREVTLNNGLDLAESKLMKKINEEDRRCIFYFLDRKGGDRGYNPKSTSELTGPGGAPLEAPAFVIDYNGKFDEPTPAA